MTTALNCSLFLPRGTVLLPEGSKITDVALAFVFFLIVRLDEDFPKILDRVVWADVDTFDAIADADDSTADVGRTEDVGTLALYSYFSHI